MHHQVSNTLMYHSKHHLIFNHNLIKMHISWHHHCSIYYPILVDILIRDYHYNNNMYCIYPDHIQNNNLLDNIYFHLHHHSLALYNINIEAKKQLSWTDMNTLWSNKWRFWLPSDGTMVGAGVVYGHLIISNSSGKLNVGNVAFPLSVNPPVLHVLSYTWIQSSSASLRYRVK